MIIKLIEMEVNEILKAHINKKLGTKLVTTGDTPDCIDDFGDSMDQPDAYEFNLTERVTVPTLPTKAPSAKEMGLS